MRSVRFLTFLILAYAACVPSGQCGNGLNDLLGVQLWGSRSLWDDVAYDTALRLKLSDQKNQSQNENQNGSYFRANLDKNAGVTVMGVRAYSIDIYSINRKVSRIVVGFVNRTDLLNEMKAEVKGNGAPVSQGNFMAAFEIRLAREREAAFEAMTNRLTKRLGPPQEEKSSTLRQWNWEKNVLTLENAELALTFRIQPEGQIPNSALATTTQIKTQKLLSRNNGDMVLKGIPPISQGPRGFCVPASWEKCLRYHGLNFDVYQLGEKGGTQEGGSAFIPFAAKIGPLLAPQHFKVQLLKKEAVGLQMVRTYIDQAAPLIWAMDGHELDFWIERSRKRTSFLNDRADGLRKDPSLDLRPIGYHALLIIGYNATVQEICLSDSTELGSGDAEIWIKESDLLSKSLPDGLVAVLPDNNPLVKGTKFTHPGTAEKKAASLASPDGKKWY